jgi:hypothetical protein
MVRTLTVNTPKPNSTPRVRTADVANAASASWNKPGTAGARRATVHAATSSMNATHSHAHAEDTPGWSSTSRTRPTTRS